MYKDSVPLISPLIASERPMVACSTGALTVPGRVSLGLEAVGDFCGSDEIGSCARQNPRGKGADKLIIARQTTVMEIT